MKTFVSKNSATAAFVMSEIASSPGQLTPVSLSETLCISHSNLFENIIKLIDDRVITKTTRQTGRTGRPNSLYWPTKKFWDNYHYITDKLAEELDEDLALINNEAVRNKQRLSRLADRDGPRIELYKSEANFLGRAAILGHCVDLSKIGKWWSGTPGWQTFITVEALKEIDVISDPLTVN